MTDRILQAFRNNRELQRLVLSEVQTTGIKLGEGAYGIVEELKVKGLVCAGKRLHKALVEQGNDGVEKIVSRFLEECKMMAEMRHLHIVQFKGICYLEGSTLPALVMERLERSLDDLLEASPGLPLPLKQSLLVDVARGLVYLHTRNPCIVHRDLSARNVLLTSSLVAKIGDLGNARIMDLQPEQLARLTRVPGTFLYMPPEAFGDSRQYGPPLDIFSFGHLALFTLTQVFLDTLLSPTYYSDPDNPGRLLGRSALERRANYIQLLKCHLREQHPLFQLVCQCLCNDPAQRPSAVELLERLEAVKGLAEGVYEHIIRCSSGGASNGDMQKTSNGCEVAKRVARKKSDFRVPSGNIAAIHFQTSNCFVAYTTVGMRPEESLWRLPLNTKYYRVPTAILFKPDGSVDSFGYDAQAEYLNLENEERLEYAYFEEIPHDKNVNREMKIKGRNGKEYYIIDVVAQILKYLKIELINHLQRGEHPLEATDFDWVITVPAIWETRGKQMMREAGYKAGLCSQERCDKLQEASVLPTAVLNESNPDKLSLALEHECAAVYCQNIFEQQVATYSQPCQSMCYLVVNIGSNTVNVSACRVSPTPDRHVQVMHQPTGNDCLGINKEFEMFLERLVNDEGFSKYLHRNDLVTKVKHSTDLSDLINKMFKEQMVVFESKGGVGSKPDAKLATRLPFTFLEVYKDDLDNGIRQMGDSRIERVGQDLRIAYSKMADFFQPVVEKMLECMSQTLRDMDANVETIYLIGGFGGSKYIYRIVTEHFGTDYKYITPAEPDFAVVRGAVLLRHDPDIVEAQKVDATYGVATSILFDPLRHAPEYKWVDDGSQEMCSNVFSTVVERGDVICTKELFKTIYVPALHRQTSASFKIYSTLEKDVWYTTGKRGRGSKGMEIRKIGEFEVQMPVLTGDKDRKIDIVFDFSHTEIHVKAYDYTSGNEVKVVLDFLSA